MHAYKDTADALKLLMGGCRCADISDDTCAAVFGAVHNVQPIKSLSFPLHSGSCHQCSHLMSLLLTQQPGLPADVASAAYPPVACFEQRVTLDC